MSTPDATTAPPPVTNEALASEVQALRTANSVLRLDNARLRAESAKNAAGFERAMAERAAIEAGLRTQLAQRREQEALGAIAEVRAIEERQSKPGG